MSLSVAQAKALATASGGADLCPKCKTYSLVIGSTGQAAQFTCSTGCTHDAIEARFELLAETTAATKTPLDVVNEVLRSNAYNIGSQPPFPAISRVAKFSSALTVIYWDDGHQTEFDAIGKLTNQTKFLDEIASSLNRVIARIEPKSWPAVPGTILAVAEIRDELDSATEELLDWLAMHARRAHYVHLDDGPDLAEKISADVTIIDHATGRLYVRPAYMIAQLRQQYSIGITRNELATRLARLGFTRKQLSARKPKLATPVKARYWAAPDDLDLHGHKRPTPLSPLYTHETPSAPRGDSGDTGTPSHRAEIRELQVGDATGTNGDESLGDAKEAA